MQLAPKRVDASDSTVRAESVEDAFAALTRKSMNSSGTAEAPGGHLAHGVAIAVFAGFGVDELPLLSGLAAWPGEVLSAKSAIALPADAAGSSVVVAFEGGDNRRPVIIGVLASRLQSHCDMPAISNPWNASSDGERLTISAQREVVLQCGEASITLTRAGKVLIRGTYVLTRSSGNNRIKGATVEIN